MLNIFRLELCLSDIDRWTLFGVKAFSEDALRDALRVLHEKELLVHAATMDIQILRSFGLEPSRIFDTQIAYAFLDCGMRIGLGPLVESLTGLVLEKGESISDWRKRPLSESQVSYALNDVAHLHTLQELLTEKMEVAGRLNWFREEMDSLLTPPSEPDELTLWKTIRRNRKLKNSPQSLAVLSHLAAWRQAAAKEADLSPNLLMRDDILVALAGSPPNTLADLGNFQGVKPATIKYHGATILYTVSQGLEAEPIEPPEEWLMSSDDEVRQHMLRKLCESVMLSVSLEMQIAPFMLCPEQSISEFAAAAPGEEVWGDGAVLLHGWRRDAVGLQLLKVKGGALAPRWAGTKIAFEDTLVSSRNDVPG